MNKHKTLIIVSVLFVLVIVGLFMWGNKVKQDDQQKIEQSKSVVLKQYVFTDVSEHGTPESCWTVIDGKVYDLTPFINNHPGGEQAIMGVCGVDGSAAFAEAHKNSTRKMSELQEYVIGEIKK